MARSCRWPWDRLAVGGHHGLIALGQSADEGVRVGDAGGPLDLLLSGIQLAEADVVGNGARKQVGILKDDAQGAAEAVLLMSRTSMPS